jgi:hypothetical protein
MVDVGDRRFVLVGSKVNLDSIKLDTYHILHKSLSEVIFMFIIVTSVLLNDYNIYLVFTDFLHHTSTGSLLQDRRLPLATA